jgi:hypothetical protein
MRLGLLAAIGATLVHSLVVPHAFVRDVQLFGLAPRAAFGNPGGLVRAGVTDGGGWRYGGASPPAWV